MKYFRWSHDQLMNMSYDNYIMYLVSIPGSSVDDDKEEEKEEVDLMHLHG